MALVKIADLYPNYKEEVFGGDDIKSFSVYDEKSDKIGSVHDILVDESGHFRYLVIDTGFWIFGKKVILPVGRAKVDYSQERVYTTGFTKQQAENLPKYDDEMTVDYDYEERVRRVYRGVDYDPSSTVYAEKAGAYNSGEYKNEAYDKDSYTYDKEPSLYSHVDTDGNQSLKLYEERLVANKERFLAGTVTVGKRVETQTASVSVPVEKEKVIIERTTPTNVREVTPGEATFNDTGVTKVEVYEETADVEKQAFVREEVSVRKEVEQDVVSTKETIRREELDVDTKGDAVINRDV